MTAQEKAFEIIKRIRRKQKLTEQEAIVLALIFVDEINGVFFDLEPAVKEPLWLYREVEATIPYWKEVEATLRRLGGQL